MVGLSYQRFVEHGPSIDDEHLFEGVKNDEEKKELISIYQFYPNKNELHSFVEERQGQWIHLNHLPNYPHERDQRNNHQYNKEENQSQKEEQIIYYLSFRSLQIEPMRNGFSPNQISFLSPQETGLASGNWLGSGSYQTPDHPIDQRYDDGNSLCFDSLPFTDSCGICNEIFRNYSKDIFFLFENYLDFPV